MTSTASCDAKLMADRQCVFVCVFTKCITCGSVLSDYAQSCLSVVPLFFLLVFCLYPLIRTFSAIINNP